jgi:hypothetical protein
MAEEMVKRTIFIIIGLILLSSCSSDNFRDVENIPSDQFTSYHLYSNIDQHPNLAVVCIDKVAFVTANRDYKPWNREPDLDYKCGGSR